MFDFLVVAIIYIIELFFLQTELQLPRNLTFYRITKSSREDHRSEQIPMATSKICLILNNHFIFKFKIMN